MGQAYGRSEKNSFWGRKYRGKVARLKSYKVTSKSRRMGETES